MKILLDSPRWVTQNPWDFTVSYLRNSQHKSTILLNAIIFYRALLFLVFLPLFASNLFLDSSFLTSHTRSISLHTHHSNSLPTQPPALCFLPRKKFFLYYSTHVVLDVNLVTRDFPFYFCAVMSFNTFRDCCFQRTNLHMIKRWCGWNLTMRTSNSQAIYISETRMTMNTWKRSALGKNSLLAHVCVCLQSATHSVSIEKSNDSLPATSNTCEANWNQK